MLKDFKKELKTKSKEELKKMYWDYRRRVELEDGSINFLTPEQLHRYFFAIEAELGN